MPAALDPMCPRCGYDLSGEVARWRSACPLGGRCSECGLELWWANVLSARLRVPAWSFEHAPGRWMLRVPRGWGASVRPRRCWGGLRMEQRVVVRRLVLSLLALFATVWATLGISSALALASETRFSMALGMRRGWMPQSSLPSVFELAWTEHRQVLFLPVVWVQTRPLEIWRGPFIGAWMAALIAATAAMPLAFLLLPQTFRRTRVRRAHLLRAAAYTSPFPAMLLITGTLVTAVLRREDLASFAWMLTAIGLAWLLGAWRRVTRDYLRLPRDRAIWATMSVVALLSGAVAGALLLPGELGAYMWILRL